jgi:pre-rRNA-processing protein TSR3
MSNDLPTCIIRHQRENLKKCSLTGLEGRSDFIFFRYPDCVQRQGGLPDFSSRYVLLSIDGPPLSEEDGASGLIIVDATWRLAAKIVAHTPALKGLPRRALPSGYGTAYPRRQNDCPDPNVGLASIEALFLAYRILGREVTGLLDHYHWKDAFLSLNAERKE